MSEDLCRESPLLLTTEYTLYKKTETLFSHLTGRWPGGKGRQRPQGSGQSPEAELTGTKTVKKCQLILDTISSKILIDEVRHFML